MVEAAAEVLVEVIPEEVLSSTHRSSHLGRFHLKRPSLELHFRFLHRVKFRVQSMQKTSSCDLNIYLDTVIVQQQAQEEGRARKEISVPMKTIGQDARASKSARA